MSQVQIECSLDTKKKLRNVMPIQKREIYIIEMCDLYVNS